MSRTVTVRVSVLLALALVLVGATVYGVAASQPDPEPPDVEGVSVSPTDRESPSAVNASDLPRVQRAVFLLAVDPGEDFGSLYTADEREQAAVRGLPDAVRYDGVVYEVHEAAGGADTVSLPLVEWAGAAVAGVGMLGLVAAGLRGSARREDA